MQKPLSTGMPDVDTALGGLWLGDNAVWVLEDEAFGAWIDAHLLAEAKRREWHAIYVATHETRPRLGSRIPEGVVVLDARPRQTYADAPALEAALLEVGASSSPLCVLIDDLDELARRWGAPAALRFFTRVCPRLFELGAIASWRASRGALGDDFLEQVRGVTQCVFEVDRGHLRIVKAEGRPAATQGQQFRLEVDADGTPRLLGERALGRLGRGLERLRRQRNLTQAELARLAGVSASAISQAEGGHRGLSLDTLLTLTERLGVSLDELLASPPTAGYRVVRHDRAAARTPWSALLDDPTLGLRAYLVRLAPGEEGEPPIVHKGAELVLVAAGLVQLRLASETPVLRGGDAALATQVAISGWRNLSAQGALFFWILRD